MIFKKCNEIAAKASGYVAESRKKVEEALPII